jgi:hypothetical protein
VKEEKPPKGLEPAARFLMACEEVDSCEQALGKVRYYVQRWKTERLRHVLKSGCATEKLQERDMEKTKTLILTYSVIAVFILNLTCIARVNPELPRGILFDEDEWKVLYCAANRRKEAPEKPYTAGEAVEYTGGPGRVPSDGPPGVKTIWRGLQKFCTLYGYREMFDFMGQV